MKLPKLFYLLGFYIFFQFGWWTFLLLEQNEEIYSDKIKSTLFLNQQQADGLKKKRNTKRFMVMGEGAVFLSLLAIGVYRISKTFSKELALNKQQSNFLLAVTHEFKSPLSAVKLNLQTLLKHKLDEERRNKLLSNSVLDCERIDMLVENALLAARIENKAYNYTFYTVDLRSLLQEIIASKNWTVKFAFQAAESLFVNGDKLALISLFRNIIDNAEKYAPEESIVTVSLHHDKDKNVVSIGDKGPGIAIKERSRIFDKFFRVGDESTRTTKGTGLGLYISRSIAEAHEGKIIYKPNSPEGSIFEVQLPLAKKR